MRRPTPLLLLAVALAAGCQRESGPSPTALLDGLDSRRPVPLLPMMASHQKQEMRDHLLAVQEIIAALAADDFAAAERASARIGSSEQTQRMCAHMGAGAPGFTEQALAFHQRADRVTAAARERDRTHVLRELAATVEACTSCHEQWKQQVVDEPTWNRLTASAAPGVGAAHRGAQDARSRPEDDELEDQGARSRDPTSSEPPPR